MYMSLYVGCYHSMAAPDPQYVPAKESASNASPTASYNFTDLTSSDHQ